MADRPQCQHYVCVNSKRTAQLLLYTQNAASYGYNAVISEVLREIGSASLKEKQREAPLTFQSGRDTFVVLPTGYDGKSLIYAMLSLVFGHRYLPSSSLPSYAYQDSYTLLAALTLRCGSRVRLLLTQT